MGVCKLDELKNSVEILDHYADAAVQMLMDQYLTAMGESIAKGAVNKEKMPETLDKKCRVLIKKRLRKQQFMLASKKLLSISRKVAMIVLMLFGVVGLLFVSVEAVRVPIINFFIEQKDGHLEIYATGDEQSSLNIGDETARNPLAGLLPEGYMLVIHRENSTGGVFVKYENESGEYILFSENCGINILDVDNEDAITEHTTLLSCPAVFIEKNEYQLAWANQEAERLCRLEASALSREQIIALAENIEKNR